MLLLVALTAVFVILVLVHRSPSLPFTVLFTALFALWWASPEPNLASAGTVIAGLL